MDTRNFANNTVPYSLVKACPTNTFGRDCHGICNCSTENTYCHPVVGCLCRPGWRPPHCSSPCDPGSYGPNCTQDCTCLNGATCDSINGSCSCTPGWMGRDCNTTCPVDRFGASCLGECSCDNGFTCDHVTGNCTFLEVTSAVIDVTTHIQEGRTSQILNYNNRHSDFLTVDFVCVMTFGKYIQK